MSSDSRGPARPLRRLGGLGPKLRGHAAIHALVAGLVILAVWSATIISVRTEQVGKKELDRLRAQDLVSVLESHATDVFGYADTYLKAARRIYERRQSIEELQAFLDDVPPNPLILSHVTVIDSAGKPIFISTGDEIGPQVNANDRDYFRFQRATPGDEIYISKQARGRNSGILSIRIARRLTDASGQFDGVIFTAIRPHQLTEPFRHFDLGRNSAVGLIGLDREVRAWSEFGRLEPRVPGDGWTLWASLDASPSGVIAETGAPDGVLREFAYLKLQKYPLVAVVGFAGVDALAAVSFFAWSAVSLAVLMTVIVLVLTIAIFRDYRLMRTLEHEVAVRRRAETAAIHATEMKSAFLTTMSHEIRTPINAIMGLFELIEGADVPDRQKRQARAGQSAANALFRQLTNVLDASRLEAKSMELSLRREPVASMIAALSQLLEAAIQASGKPIRAVTRIDEDVPETLRMDRRRVEQIILNFIDNAVKFTESGEIELRASVEPHGAAQHLVLSIGDTGPGISKADQKRIFTRFSQLNSAITRRAGGTGLGLSICSDLAVLMQARLRVVSRVGDGSCFALMLKIE